GGSDAGLIAEMIVNAKLCLPCIARKTGVPVAEANATLTKIAASLRLRVGPHRCDSCLHEKTTFSVTRDGGSSVEASDGQPGAAAIQTPEAALWQFLSLHRGQAFCAACLAAALGVTGRIDRAIMGAEGRGARRHHGPCGSCGKDRLTTGLR